MTWAWYCFPVCVCDPKGTVNRSNICEPDEKGQCTCKLNVHGVRCDTCNDTFYGLNHDNLLGCQGKGRLDTGWLSVVIGFGSVGLLGVRLFAHLVTPRLGLNPDPTVLILKDFRVSFFFSCFQIFSFSFCFLSLSFRFLSLLHHVVDIKMVEDSWSIPAIHFNPTYIAACLISM